LVAWNQRYQQLFDYPAGLVAVGRPIQDLIRYNATRGWVVSADVEAAVERRLAFMRAGKPHSHERELQTARLSRSWATRCPAAGS